MGCLAGKVPVSWVSFRGLWGRRMRFKHLEGKLGPTNLETMRRAYDTVCAELKIGPDDPLAASVAAKIISLSADGQSDTDSLVRLCVESLKLPRDKLRRRKGSVPN